MAGRNLAGLVEAAAASSPLRTALYGATGSLTWGELGERVDRLAAGLAGLGLVPGNRVGLLLGNTPDFATGYFAVLRAGLVAVPLNTSYTSPELSHQLHDAGVRAVLAAPNVAGVVTDLQASLPELEQVIVAPGPAFDALLASQPAPAAERGGEDLAVLIYTSGTSGRPKGAMLTHRALLANLDQIGLVRPAVVGPEDVVLLVVPLFHIYGLNAGLGMVAATGATGVLVERFDPVDTLATVAERSVTTIIGAPPVYVAWSMLPEARTALSGIRLAMSGAAPLPPAVLETLRESAGLAVFEGYGLTETAPALTTTLRSPTPKPGSIGRPLPGVLLRLVDGAGRPVDDDDPGEITVKGPNLFSGYWPDGREGPDPQGWFRTGDVAYADADGDLFLVDRIRELILVSGFNVYPREVEDVLLSHPDIAEAAAIGIPHPYTGESVKALVVPRPGAALSSEQVVDFCALSLARFKCPTAVDFVAALPHSATGKVSKGRLREGAPLPRGG
ncbi:MAG: AMP-binding protein [Mycobacteriales bacterium]